MKGKNNQDRLAALRDKLQKTDMSTGSSGFWSAPVGRSVIRILPEVGDMQYFFQPVGRHSMSPDGKKQVYCPDFTSEGELPCPVCELVSDLKKAGDTASKKLAGQLARRRAFWMNIIVRGSEKDGPQVFTPGVQVMNYIAAIIADPDYGDITDPKEGFDITIEREGRGLDTEYQVRARRQPSVLSDDPKEIKQWLEKARDLSYVELSDDPEEDKDIAGNHAVWVSPYDRIVREYDLDNLGDEDFEDDEEEEPVKSSKTSKPATRKPVVEEVEEDDEEEYEDDEEEEEEPVKQPARKMARRSTRR